MIQTITHSASVPETTGRRGRLTAGPDILFCYGTLQFDAVLEGLLGRIPARAPASAPGWRAAALEGRVYPGLVHSQHGVSAEGIILTDLSDLEWQILDTFEDDVYELQPLILASGRSGWAYVWPAGEVLDRNWDPDAFADAHLQAYAARCARIGLSLAERVGHS
ncbi:gamma-glutamylcyclotransferase family protein [Streptomyces canus]|uniref:gamma-glutamylcyclotransferase family protein n=1 Tax=Streptomyces canus TaxID=58343 RepID=UPI0033E40C0D